MRPWPGCERLEQRAADQRGSGQSGTLPELPQ